MVPSTGYLMEEVPPTFHGAYDDDQLYDLASQQLQNRPPHRRAGGFEGGQGKRADLLPHRPPPHLLWELSPLPRLPNCPGCALPLRDAYEVASYDGFYGTTWSGGGYWGVAPDRLEVWDSGIQPTVTLIDGGMEPQVSDSLFFPRPLGGR